MFGAHNLRLPRLHRMINVMHATTDSESNDRGATMVEYGLLLAFVLLAAFFSLVVFGESLVGLFDTTSSTMDSAPGVNPEG